MNRITQLESYSLEYTGGTMIVAYVASAVLLLLQYTRAF